MRGDDTERVADLVRDGAGEPADLGEALGVIGADLGARDAVLEIADADGVLEEESARFFDDDHAHRIERERGEERDEDEPRERAAGARREHRQDAKEHREADRGERRGEHGVGDPLNDDAA